MSQEKTDVKAIALHRAALCMDCDFISDTTLNCPVCGSSSLLNVEKALNAEYDEKNHPHVKGKGKTKP